MQDSMADIPADTLFNIFLFLKRSELAHASAVSQAWRKVARNPHFLLPIVLKYKLGCGRHYGVTDKKNGLPLENDTVVFNDLEVRSAWGGTNLIVKYGLQDSVFVKEMRFRAFDWYDDPASESEIVALYKLAKSNPTHYKFEIVPIHKPTQIEAKMGDHTRRTHTLDISYQAFFRLSISTFERHFSKKPYSSDYPGSQYIFKGVAEEHAYLISKWCSNHEFKQATIPVKTFVPQKQPHGFGSHIQLKKYQLNAISWMKSIEEDVNIGFNCSELVGWKAAGTKVLFDIIDNNFVVGNEVEAYVKHVTAKGGVLADEMGLGKTLEMVGLILANPGNPMNVSRIDDKIEEEEEETETNTTVTTNIKDLISDSEGEEPPAKKPKGDKDDKQDDIQEESKPEKTTDKGAGNEDKSKQEEKGKEKSEDDEEKPKAEAKALPERLLFKTQATIVFCPNHLVQQWQSEIAKHTSPPLCVVILTTKNDLASTTYNDIVEADIVIVSLSLLKNPNYFNLGRGGTSSIKGAEEKRMKSWVPTSLRRIRESSGGGLAKKNPILEHFSYRRMIVDEGHEVLADPFYQFTFNQYTASYHWYMSGTPFPNEDVMAGVTKYLQFPPTEAYKSWCYVDLMVENLYWRNTKESIKDEFDIPATVEDVVLMDFTDIEQTFYNEAATEDAKRELCCWLQLNNQVQAIVGDSDITLTQSRASMIAHKKSIIKNCVASINTYKKELSELKKLNQTPYRENNIKRINERMKQEKDQIKKVVRELIKFEQTHTYTGPDMSSTANITTADEPKPSKVEEKKPEEKEKADKEEEKEQDDKENDDVEMDEEEEEEEGEDLNSFTVPQLKAKLKKLGVDLPKKSIRKAELIALFPQAGKATKKAAKDEPKKEPVKKGKGKAKAEEKNEDKSSAKRKRDDRDEEAEAEDTKQDANEDESTPLPIKRSESLLKTKQSDHLNLRYLVEQLGTKLGNFVHYMKKLWEENPKHRVIVFSQFNTLLSQISDVLQFNGIESAFVQGNVLRRNKALKSFKSEDSSIRVILLSLENAASGTNLMEASHIILMDPVTGTRKEAQAIESQAIGRAHRQGQTNQVTIVRFLIRGTIEHDMYIKNYLEEVEEAEQNEKMNTSLNDTTELDSTPVSTPLKRQASHTNSSTPKLVRTSTIGTLLANNKNLRNDSGIMDLLENDDVM